MGEESKPPAARDESAAIDPALGRLWPGPPRDRKPKKPSGQQAPAADGPEPTDTTEDGPAGRA